MKHMSANTMFFYNYKSEQKGSPQSYPRNLKKLKGVTQVASFTQLPSPSDRND